MHEDTEAPRSQHLGDFTTDRRVIILSAMALVVGALGALAAWVLSFLIASISNLVFYQELSGVLRSPSQHHLGPWILVVPVIGGLVIGLMARYGSEKIRGHGIPEAIEAILIGRSRVDARVAILKPLSSAIAIGTGGPFGAEGPIVMTGGALGSLFAQRFHLSAAERKTLLVAGAAAGMAAIFSAPVAAVLLAVELLLFEWKPRSFVPVAIAASLAAALRVPLLGHGPVFPMPLHAAPSASILGWTLLVGIIAGLASGGLTLLVYGFEDLFQRLPIHWMWWPAIGGLAIGIGGLIDPRVLGVGYDSIHGLLLGEIVGVALLGLLLLKPLVWSIALGSGTSGGVLAPLLLIGGALGAVEARFIPAGDAGWWALISMAAMMGGTMRAPLTAMAFALELTGDYPALPALLLACVAAQATTVLLMRRSILTEKISRRGLHLIREYAVDPLQVVRVGEAMDEDPATVPATMPVGELADAIARHDERMSRRQAVLVTHADGTLAGIITRGDVVRALARERGREESVLDAGSRTLVVAHPDEVVAEAVGRMLRAGVGRLPVVDRENPRRIVGYLGRAGILGVRMGQLQEEDVREAGSRRT